MGVRVIIH